MSRSLCFAAVAVLALTACTHAPAKDSAAQPVRFAITLPADQFAPGSTVRVAVWNQAKLAARARSGGCAVGHDATGDHVMCPPGVTYTPAPTPEEFEFTVDELGHGFTIAALSLRAGEAYELAIGGSASDGCNHVGGSARGRVDRADIAIGDVQLYTTDMACAPRPM